MKKKTGKSICIFSAKGGVGKIQILLPVFFFMKPLPF